MCKEILELPLIACGAQNSRSLGSPVVFSLLFKLAALPRFPPQPMIFSLLEKREVSVALRSASLPVETFTSNNQ